MLSRLFKAGLAAATLMALWATTPEAQAQRGRGWGVGAGRSGVYVGPSYGGYYGNRWYGNSYSGNRWYGDGYWNSGYYRPYSSSWYGNRYYSTPNYTYYSTPSYTTDYYPSTTTYSQSFYPPVQTQSASTARVHVRVNDANAEVFFNGTATQQRGIDRIFETPPLDASSHNSYTVRARWMGSNGQMMDRTKHVDVQAGSEVFVDFTQAQ